MDTPQKTLSTVLDMLLTAWGNEDKVAYTVQLEPEYVALMSEGVIIDAQPGLSIYLGCDEVNFFALTLKCANVRAGYSVENGRSGVADFSFSANWEGEHFAQSATQETYTTLEIHSLGPSEMVIEISAKLLSIASDNFLIVPPSTVTIRGDLVAAVQR